MTVEGLDMRGNRGGDMQYPAEEGGETCRQVLSLLCAYVDGEATDKERAEVEKHVHACSRCGRELALLREAVALASVLQEADVPAGLHERIMSATVRRPTLSARLRSVLGGARLVPALRACAALGAAALVLGVLASRTAHQRAAERRSTDRLTASRPSVQPQQRAGLRLSTPAAAVPSEPLVAELPSAPAKPQPTRVAPAVAAHRGKLLAAVVRPASSAPATSAPAAASESSELPEDADAGYLDEAEWFDLDAAGASGTPAQPQEARPTHPIIVKAPQPEPPSPDTASQLLRKVPVMVASAPTAQTAADTKEWQARQFMEITRQLAQESAHGERRQLNIDLVRMRF